MKRIIPGLALTLALAATTVSAWAFWSAPGAGSAAAATGSLDAATISVPALALDSVTVTWTQQASLVPAPTENSAITYSVERKLGAGSWAAVTSGGCSGAKPHGIASCSDAPPASGSYTHRAVATYRTWTATSAAAGPVSFVADSTAPTNAVTLSGVTGGAFKSGATVYYRGSAAGSFRLTNAVADSGSGPASSATAALSGTATGWVHSPSVVNTPAGGPYVSNAFSWSALTTSSPGETVTGSDVAGNTAATALTFTDDSTAPTGGTVDATGLGGAGGRYSTSTTLSIAFTPGTDGGAGLAASGAKLLRASASLGDGSCGTYGAYAQIGADDPVSPVANTVPVDHTCYRFQHVVSDRVGNPATYTSPDIKVDSANPHPDFLQPITSPETVRDGPAGMATGDVDNDGDQDIVTSAIFASTTSVLINNGVGDFREKTVGSNGATLDAGLGKFDNDGNLDLVLLYQQTPPATGLLVLFKGGGDGSFTYLAGVNDIVATGVRSTALAVGDFNGDVIDDVAVVNSQNAPDTTAGTVFTFLGNPAGNVTFSSATPVQTLSAQIGATDIGFADFNGGAKDLVVTNYASNSITFLGGNGTGFNAPANIAAGASVGTLDTAFLNAGTNRDIVATVRNSSPSAVRTLFGNGSGGFPTQATTAAATVATGINPQAIVAKDFDNDGDVDVALTNASPSTVSVLANDGAGTYTIAPASPETGVGAPGTLPFGLVSADFDGSGYNDLAASPVFTAPGDARILANQNGNKANLSITLADAPDPVTTAAQSLTYTLTVANAGAGTPTSVKATDALPTGVTFNAAASSPGCSAAGTTPVTVTCDYGTVAPGSPESLQIVVTTNTATPASVTNTATVAGNQADGTPADNTSSATTTVTDATVPTISRAVAAKTDGSTPGTIRQGGDYYLYAQVTDNRTVSTVTANAGSFDTGVTAASLSATGGPWTVGGLTYNYRSATLTADTPLTTGTTPSYTITATDPAANTAGPTAYTATIETYSSVISTTFGLASYWRFNDGAISGDEFAGAGVVLSSHTGAIGASWTAVPSQARTALITSVDRVRKETGNGAAQYYASGTPSSANYLVESDVHVVSLLATDAAAVVGRQDISGTGQTYYLARFVRDTGRWELGKVIAGALTLIGTGTGTGYYTQAPAATAGSVYRVTLQMSGGAISLLVDGVPRITAPSDLSITVAGRGGVRLGTGTTTAQVSDSAGLHLDNFRISSLTTAADDIAAANNNGTFTNGAVLNEAGALVGDTDRAARLDGANDYVTVPDAASLDLGDGPFTLEAWVKRSNVNTAGISIFQKGASALQFGFYLDNTFLAKDNVGTVASSTTTVTGTGWHHLVVTKTGLLTKLYIDGVDRTGVVTDQTLINTTAALFLGSKNGTSEFLAATIDEFAVYNAVLSGATVLDHYKAGLGTG